MKRLGLGDLGAGHPRSQGLTADTALPKALAKTKTRSDLIGRMKTMECGN